MIRPIAMLLMVACPWPCLALAEEKPVSLFDGRTLEGWKLAKDNAYIKPGKVAVAKGAIVMEKGNIATGIVYDDKKPFPRSNYVVQLEARRTEGSDFFCGMTFPVGKSYCTFICGGWGGGVTGLSNVDNFSADENQTTGYEEFKNGQWYKIRLKVTDQKIEAWIDKRRIVDQQIKDRKFDIWWEQEPLRPFGIGNWHTASELRNITLTRLK